VEPILKAIQNFRINLVSETNAIDQALNFLKDQAYLNKEHATAPDHVSFPVSILYKSVLHVAGSRTPLNHVMASRILPLPILLNQTNPTKTNGLESNITFKFYKQFNA
jgi:hypothetical protein